MPQPFSRSIAAAAQRWGVAGLTMLLIAAAPATKPTDPKPQPKAKPNPADRLTTEFVSPPVAARFRVPKTWQTQEIKGGTPGKMFLFNPAPASKNPSPFLQLIEITFDRPQAKQKALADVVESLRAVLLKKTPGLKFTKDAAIKFGTHSAWTLQWTEQTKLTVAPAGGGPNKESTMETDRAEIVFLEHNTICDFGYFADPNFMASLIQKGNGVAKTVAWDD